MVVVSEEKEPGESNPVRDVTSKRPVFNTLTIIFGAGVALIGILGIIGLIFNITLFTSVFQGYKTIAFSASVIWIIFGSVLACHAATPLRGSVRTCVAAVVALIAILAALEFPLNILGKHFIVEIWSVRIADTFSASPTTPISPVAVVLLIPIAIALFFLLYAEGPSKEEKLARDVVGITGLAISLVSFTFVLSYIDGAPFLYNTPLIPIALTSALAALLTGAGLITAAGSRAIPLKYLTGTSTHALLLRIFLPFILIIILVENFLMIGIAFIYNINNAIMLSVSLIIFSIVITYVVAKVSERLGHALDRAEKALKASEIRFRTMIDWTYDWEYWIDEHRKIIYMAPSVERITGYHPDEFIAEPDLINRIVHPDDLKMWGAHIPLHLSKNDIITREIKFRIIHKDGSVRWIGHVCRSIISDDGTYMGRRVSNRDITERTHAEEALRESKALVDAVVENVPFMIFLKEAKDLRFVIFNRAGEELLGYDRQALLGKNNLDLFPPGEAEQFMTKDREVLDGDAGFLDIPEEPITTAKKGVRLLHTRKVCIRGADGTTKFLLGISEDITDRKMMEEEIQSINKSLEKRVEQRTTELNASLQDKIVLLREVHHRVKNNLQIIISLLNLQSRYIEDEKTARVIRESQNRIRAMALVHEKLHQSADIAHIDLDGYIRFLGNSLFQFYGMSGKGIILHTQIRDINLDLDTSIPLGLIVNELISNSLKYAFPEGRKGEISIAIQRENGMLNLVYKDNGVGIPADFDWRNPKSLGLRLVIGLVEQLQGTIELDRTAGTTFNIVVKEKK